MRKPTACLKPKPAAFLSPFPPSRCGSCEGCLKLKRWKWKARIMCECAGHSKNWFATLTYKGDERNAQYKNIQDFLKRVRKNSGLQVRYLVATERGALRDRLHWHMVLHGPKELTYRQLHANWRLSDGISEFTLIRDSGKAARYASKAAGYVVKDRTSRRTPCSNGYGSEGLTRLAAKENENGTSLSNLVEAVQKQWPNARVDNVRVRGVLLPREVFKRHSSLGRVPANDRPNPHPKCRCADCISNGYH